MEPKEIFNILLLVLLIVCALAVNVTRNLLQAVIIFMAYSSMMCLVWILMESPDLAITEAAVGAGVSGTLFLVTLKKIRQEDEKWEEKREENQEGISKAETEEKKEKGEPERKESCCSREVSSHE